MSLLALEMIAMYATGAFATYCVFRAWRATR